MNRSSTDTPRLLVAESSGFDPQAAAQLSAHFTTTFADLERPELIQRIGEYDVLWVRLRTMIDEAVLKNANRLRTIVTNTTGLNHIDMAAAQKRGIGVLSLRGESEFLKSIRATAEHTIALTLALLRKIPQSHQHVLDGNWDRTQFQGEEIYQRSVGIIGYGRLGSIVAEYFRAFGAEVLISSRELSPGSHVQGMPALSVPDLCRRSDIVSLHASYDPENRHMINDDFFANMKPTSVFINTARGEMVDERALLDALVTDRIAGAAIDVIDGEHQRGQNHQQLIEFAANSSRLVMTPHIGGNTPASLARTERFMAYKLLRHCGLG